jgi:hypothetical protein
MGTAGDGSEVVDGDVESIFPAQLFVVVVSTDSAKIAAN